MYSVKSPLFSMLTAMVWADVPLVTFICSLSVSHHQFAVGGGGAMVATV